MTACPSCGAPGRTISAVTLGAQVVPSRLAGLASREGWRLCTGPACDVVYFRGDDVIERAAVLAVPFHKSAAADRTVCFCFGHTAAAIVADAGELGASRVRAAIVEACRAGRDDCERQSPQGRCCLGNVDAVWREARAGSAPSGSASELAACVGEPSSEPAPEEPACVCEPSPEPARELAPEAPACGCEPSPEAPAATARAAAPRSGRLAVGGALVAAVLSSACCWLPLAAIGLGVSAAGVGAFFERWRVPLLLVTASLLALVFWLSYRKPRCAPGDACAVPDRRLRRVNRAMLWLTTLLVLGFALFPSYLGAFTGDPDAPSAVIAPTQTVTRYAVAGMSCEGCVAHVREALAALPGVASAAVSYAGRRATVVWTAAPDDGAIGATLSALGYTATRSP